MRGVLLLVVTGALVGCAGTPPEDDAPAKAGEAESRGIVTNEPEDHIGVAVSDFLWWPPPPPPVWNAFEVKPLTKRMTGTHEVSR